MSDVLTVREAAEAFNALADAIAERVAARLGRPIDTRLLSTAEAARETGQSVNAIRAAVSAGELAHVRVGRVFKFRRSDLDAWIDRNRIA